MEIRNTVLPGCLQLQPRVQKDHRGRFVKVFNCEDFAARGLETRFVEEYYSVSTQGVLRGLHFQLPPHAHSKRVYCVQGRVMDVVVDLRADSPTYGRHVVINLDGGRGNMVYIPPGMAHGFYVADGSATLVYKVSSLYSPQHDSGIRWDSAGIAWPTDNPILSERDRGFATLADFPTPFRFGSDELEYVR